MGKYVTLDKVEPMNADTLRGNDVIQEAIKTVSEWVEEAYLKAIQEGIKANTVIINEHFAKVNEFSLTLGRSTSLLPPMLCGLQVYVTKELPDGYDFGLLEAPMTEREALVNETEKRVAREIFEELERHIYFNFRFAKEESAFGEYSTDYLEGRIEMGNDLKKLIAELKKKYNGGIKR